MIARLSVYAPSRSDCEMLIQVVRWYFWLVWTVQEAKLSLTKLRTLLFGRGPKPPPSDPEDLVSPDVQPVAMRPSPAVATARRRAPRPHGMKTRAIRRIRAAHAQRRPSPRHGSPGRGGL